MSTDLRSLVAALTLEEKASLTAGADLWSVPGVARLGIPALCVTDGPNGARGAAVPGQAASPTTCVPCGSALGATWDPDLVRAVGELLGDEARAKGCRVLLAPTVNIPRSPLAGRNFECYSEDPLLSGRLAAAFVAGVQSRGVATTVKHLVANDAETERMTMSSVVDPRTLREVYLLPFELAVRLGGSLGVMTAYNRLNGTWCDEHPALLAVLRHEWGFEGFVVSDWYAVASTEGSAAAGLDLEMPGPGRAYGAALADAVRQGRVPESSLDAAVGHLLGVMDRLGLLDGAGDAALPSRPAADRRRHLARRAAAASFVLLENDGLLPLPGGLRSLAVLGAGARQLALMGGGSAQVTADPSPTLAAALAERLVGTEVCDEPGVDLGRGAPVLDIDLALEFMAGDDLAGPVVHRATRRGTEARYVGAPYGAVEGPYCLRATGRFVPATTGDHVLTLSEVGRARVLVDGTVVVDGMAGDRPRGRTFMGLGRVELAGTVALVAGRPAEVVLEYASDGDHGIGGFRVGCRPAAPDDLADRAVAAAAAADAVVLVVGTTGEWESEGFDRDDLALPAGQAELVARVRAANPRTAVVVNAGAPVDLAAAAGPGALLQAWFGGQGMAEALADVLTGADEPGGRLAVTVPRRIEDTPAWGNFPTEDGEIRYGERLLVGYRWYRSRHVEPAYPFGHGLTYTTFEWGDPVLDAEGWAPGAVVTVTVPVTNTGDRRGAEVVQCYVAPPPGPVFRPAVELKAFARVTLAPGASADAVLTLEGRSFAHWDEGEAGAAALRARLPTSGLAPPPPVSDDGPGWRVAGGRYTLHLGRSSADTVATVVLPVAAAFLGGTPPGP